MIVPGSLKQQTWWNSKGLQRMDKLYVPNCLKLSLKFVFKPLLVDSLVENMIGDMIGDIIVFDIQSLPNVYYANSFMSRSGKLCR
jgi:hypothetical protein